MKLHTHFSMLSKCNYFVIVGYETLNFVTKSQTFCNILIHTRFWIDIVNTKTETSFWYIYCIDWIYIGLLSCQYLE